jgi:hypothetical protein
MSINAFANEKISLQTLKCFDRLSMTSYFDARFARAFILKFYSSQNKESAFPS